MIVSQAKLHRVSLPLIHDFRTSSHSKRYLDHIVVSLQDELGNTGWGEIASPSHPYYGPETTETCWQIAATELIPALLGTSFDTPREACALWDRVRGNYFAKAGFDMAVWDLWSQRRGDSLAQSLGGTRTEVTAGVSLGIEPTIDDLLKQVQVHLDHGYQRIKLKIQPGWDVAPVAAVREKFGELMLHVDANGVYREAPEHLSALYELDNYSLSMIEQPFAAHDLLAHARLQERISTPVCLDESIDDLDQLHTAIELKALQVLNIKVSRMGGLSAAVAAHDLCQAHGIPVWCGGMHEFGIGRAANLALSALPGFILPSDVSGSDKYYARDILCEPITASAGQVQVPSAPGLGIRVDHKFLSAQTLQVQEFFQQDHSVSDLS